MKNDVLDFWFSDLSPKDWYRKDSSLDRIIKERFEDCYWSATRGELFSWRTDIKGRLAEIIVLDQFSRNIFRDQAQAFQYDSVALTLAQEASNRTDLSDLTTSELAFLYMPYMHSESLLVHEEAVRLFSEPGLEMNLKFEHKHKAIIERFGRYPHRNQILGRVSTSEEIEFLQTPGSSF